MAEHEQHHEDEVGQSQKNRQEIERGSDQPHRRTNEKLERPEKAFHQNIHFHPL